MSWHLRASFPACSVLRPICWTGSPSFHFQMPRFDAPATPPDSP